MTPKAKKIVKTVLEHWRRGALHRIPHVNLLIQLCRELEKEMK